MGATDDPNLAGMDFDYDSRINLPDFGVVARDYGYTADPNQPGCHDPNCARSDFNGDGHVNLGDLAVLAEHWLIPVFDEYRFCSLCNFYDDPNEAVGGRVVDEADMDVFMEDWGKQFASDPNIVIGFSNSQLTVSVQNPTLVWGTSAFLDDQLIGRWSADGLGTSVFTEDLTRLGPGSHKLKVVNNIDYGLQIAEMVISDPNMCDLYYADIPDTFEPNEPYEIRGFNLYDGELSISIKDIYDQSIYDVNVPAGYVSVCVPASALAGNQIATLSAKTEDDSASIEEELVKEFRQEDYDGKTVQMVIITPDTKIFKSRKSSIIACAKACDARSVNWVALYHKDVTPDNLTYLLGRPTVRYVYWCGDGNSHVGRTPEQEEQDTGGVPRTCMTCWKPGEHWWNRDEESRAFSYFHDLYPLPDDWDNRGFSLWSIQMYDTVNKWIVFIDCCRSAVTEMDDVPDMARTFGISNSGNNNQIYIGWRADVTTTQSGPREVFSPRNFEKYTTKINPGIKRFWEQMGAGSTVYNALQATTEYDDLTEAETVLALWGYNMQMDLSGQDEDDYKRDNIRVFGNGVNNKLGNSN